MPYRFLHLLLPPDVGLDGLPDCKLAGTLADFREVGAGEAASHLGEVGDVHLVGNRRLSEVGLQDGHPGRLVRQRDVNQLIQTARAKYQRFT